MLTDADCRNASCPPVQKRRRLTDSTGLYLEVSSGGSKRWFWKFSPDGKESRLALGSCPDVTLKAARLAMDEARKARESGVNPVQQRKAYKITSAAVAATTFEAVAREFFATTKDGWSAKYSARWIERMEKDLFHWMGSLLLASITAPILLVALRRVEKRGALETAPTLRQPSRRVFRYGILSGRCTFNPALDLNGALKPINVKHMSALLVPVSAR